MTDEVDFIMEAAVGFGIGVLGAAVLGFMMVLLYRFVMEE
jgi:hypothetical protein